MIREEITLTNEEVQDIVLKLCAVPEKKMASKALDLLCEMKGEYSHLVAHELVIRAKNLQKNGRGRTAHKVSAEQHETWAKTVVFSY